jgi:hypothetical protein
MREAEMANIAGWIAEVLQNVGDTALQQRVRAEVAALAARFPLYERRAQGPDGTPYRYQGAPTRP